MKTSARSAEASQSRRRLKALILVVSVALGLVAGLETIGAVWEGWVNDRLLELRAEVFGAEDSQIPAQLSSREAPVSSPGSGEERSHVASLVQGRFPVAVVGLDSASLNSPSLQSIPRVFMSKAFAEAGEAVFQAGAKSVGFDFIFAFSADSFVEPVSGEKRLKGYDRDFLSFLYRHRGHVVLARTANGVPHRTFAAVVGQDGVGSAEIRPSSDGVVRGNRMHSHNGGAPSFIDLLLGAAGDNVHAPYVALPRARLASSLPYLSMIDVLHLSRSAAGREKLKQFASGRIILFGSTLAGEDEHLYADRFLPALTNAENVTGAHGRPPVRSATAGVFILADLVAAPFSGEYAVNAPKMSVTLLALIFALAGAVAGLAFPLWSLPLVGIFLTAGGLAVSLGGLDQGLVIPPGALSVAALAAFIVAAIAKIGILKRRERELVRLFGHYLSPEVIHQMAEREQLSDLGGETRFVVIAFVDIAGFTRMSERLADREAVTVVNACFDLIGRLVTQNEGYIDKYIGDAVMAVWNAPNTVEQPERRAIDFSRELVEALPDLRRVTGQAELDLRISLNAGPALVGDIGGEDRRSFTVMGTTVNTASRIETIAKSSKVRLAFSHTLAEKLPSEGYETHLLWKGRLRGLSHETRVYTLNEPAMWMDEPLANEDAKKPGTEKAEPDADGIAVRTANARA